MMTETGCVRSIIISDYCLIAEHIYNRCPLVGELQKLGQDTQETCKLIDIHNATYDVVCKE